MTTMRPPTKLGKHVEEGPISESSCLVDRISSLPDELLGHILSFLPTTRCAVRTSILSTRWRYLFTFTTSLSFDVAPCRSHSGLDENTKATRRFKEFVNKVLELHQISPINKFSLLCRDSHDNDLDLNRWLSTAAQKGVQELHYELADHLYDRVPCVRECVPDDFFLCETLVKLTMIGFGHNEIQIPLSVWLPKLKIIHLDRVTFSDFDSMKRLFSSCQVLEELTLKSCNCDDDDDHVVYRSYILRVLTIEHCSFSSGTFEIDALNLAYLSYSSNEGVRIAPSLKYSASFVEAKLIFNCTAYTEEDSEFETSEDAVEYKRELITAAADKTTELRFEKDSVEVLLLGDNEDMPEFNNLTKLVLDHFPYEAWENVTSLIDKSPRLETLIFDTGFRCCSCNHYCGEDVVCYCDSLSPSDIPLDSFSCQVQSIEVREFCGHKGSLALMEHLLKNASALKKLIVYRDDDDYLELEVKLLMFPRASKDSCLEIKRSA